MTRATLLDSAQLRAVLDAMPAAVFVVDRQTCIVDLNRAARQLVGLRRQPSQRQLCGELLRCCQERTAPAGCGSGPACPGCTIRNAILAAIRNRRTFRQRHTLIVLDHGTPRTLQTLVTASALRLNGTSMALVVIEDITELSELKSIVPICANCKKIRNDNNFWEQVENYLTAHTDLTFSHSICPECARKLYPDAAE